MKFRDDVGKFKIIVLHWVGGWTITTAITELGTVTQWSNLTGYFLASSLNFVLIKLAALYCDCFGGHWSIFRPVAPKWYA